jgi:hypothetical protein
LSGGEDPAAESEGERLCRQVGTHNPGHGVILDYSAEYGAAPDGPQLAPAVATCPFADLVAQNSQFGRSVAPAEHRRQASRLQVGVRICRPVQGRPWSGYRADVASLHVAVLITGLGITGEADLAAVTAADIAAFTVCRASRRNPADMQDLMTAMRSLLGFLHVTGRMTARLDAAVPSAPGRRGDLASARDRSRAGSRAACTCSRGSFAVGCGALRLSQLG